MSTTIDQKVVEMRFDNKQFESNVSTTMSTLDKLRQSLNMNGATQGLENVNSAVKKCDVSMLGNAVETVRSKFSALEVMGVTALANITNSAVNAGRRIVSSLTIDPIKTGFSEYETQINAIQTILANTESKGTTLNDVNGALDELNAYADKTIYNFTEMTRNIGTFTAAGVDLDTSVSAIKGIANLAAVSGSTSQQASTAMYQLSQALSSGTVKLMDWNSVVNAGMGGQVFQDALKETARVHGIAIDDLIAKEGSFRETLQHGWLSSEILTETLAKFTGDLNAEQLKSMGYTDEQIKKILKMGETANDAATKVKTFSQLFDTLKEAAQSGWTQTWEILVGDFEEAKELLTEVSDTVGAMIGASAEARNELLENWKVMGGRADLIEAIRNAFQGVMSVVTPVKEAFREIFPPLTAEQLFKFTEGLKNLTAKLKLGDTASENLKRTFRGLFAVVDIAKEAFVAVFKGVTSLLGGVGKLGGGILNVTGNFGDWLVNLRNVIKESDIFNKIIGGIVTVVKAAFSSFSSFVGILKKYVVSPGLELIHNLLERVGVRMSGLGTIAEKMRSGMVNAFEAIGSALEKCSLFKIFESLWNVILAVGKGIGMIFGTFASGAVSKLSNISFQGIIDFLNSLLAGGLGIGLIKLIKKLDGPINALTDGIDNAKGIFSGISGIFDSVRDSLSAWQQNLQADTLMKIAAAVGILAASIIILSTIDSAKLTASLGTITTLFAELMGSMAIFSKISGKFDSVQKACTAMISISIAVLILASALKKVASLDYDELLRGLVGVAGLMAIVVAAVKVFQNEGKTVIKGATQMIIFAAAIKILASVCKDLSELSWGGMIKGLLGVGALLAGVSLFMNNTNFNSKAFTTGLGMILLAAAIKILASACADFTQMKPGEMVKGLAAIAVVLGELVAFTKFIGDSNKMISTGIGLIAIAAAMKIFASAIGDMGRLSIAEVGKGLLGMAGALAAVVVALKFLPKNMTMTSVGLIAVATAMLILSNALSNMGGMSWEGVGKGLLVLGASLGMLALGLNLMTGTLAGSAALLVAALALNVLVPAIAMLSGMSWGSIIKGLVTLAAAFTIVGVAGYLLAPITPYILMLGAALALVGVGILAAGTGLVALAAGIGALISAVSVGAAAIVSAIVAICTGIVSAIPEIAKAIFAIITAVLGAITQAVPSLMTCIGTILDGVLTLLIEYVPKIVEAGMKIILGFLQGVGAHIGDVIDAAVTLIVNFVNGIADGLPRVIDAGMNLVIKFINGLADGIRKNTPAMIAAVNNLMDAVMEAIAAWFKNAVSRGKELAGKVGDGIKKGISGIKQAGKDAISGFIEGIKDKLSAAADAAKSVGKKALNAIKNALGIKSPSREFAKVGRYSDEGLIKGLTSLSGKVAKTAGGVGNTALNSMKSAISGIVDAINSDVDPQPTIRPVLDLSDVRSGAGDISRIFGAGASVGVMANVGAISSSMSQRNQNGANDDVVSAIDKLRKDIGNTGGTTYQINGITYDDGTNVSEAVKSLVRAARIERRV